MIASGLVDYYMKYDVNYVHVLHVNYPENVRFYIIFTIINVVFEAF